MIYSFPTSREKAARSRLSEEEEKELKKGLRSVSSFIRSQLAQRLNLRITPKLTFIREHGAEKAMDIAKILKDFNDEQQNLEK